MPPSVAQTLKWFRRFGMAISSFYPVNQEESQYIYFCNIANPANILTNLARHFCKSASNVASCCSSIFRASQWFGKSAKLLLGHFSVHNYLRISVFISHTNYFCNWWIVCSLDEIATTLAAQSARSRGTRIWRSVISSFLIRYQLCRESSSSWWMPVSALMSAYLFWFCSKSKGWLVSSTSFRKCSMHLAVSESVE